MSKSYSFTPKSQQVPTTERYSCSKSLSLERNDEQGVKSFVLRWIEWLPGRDLILVRILVRVMGQWVTSQTHQRLRGIQPDGILPWWNSKTSIRGDALCSSPPISCHTRTSVSITCKNQLGSCFSKRPTLGGYFLHPKLWNDLTESISSEWENWENFQRKSHRIVWMHPQLGVSVSQPVSHSRFDAREIHELTRFSGDFPRKSVLKIFVLHVPFNEAKAAKSVERKCFKWNMNQ